jgi:hypothetical protein
MVSDLYSCSQWLLTGDRIGINREKVKQHAVNSLLSAVTAGRSIVDN